MSVTVSGGGASLELRQLIGDLVPGSLGADEKVKAGALARRRVENAEAQIQLAAAALLAEQAGAAVASEGGGGLGGFLEAADGLLSSSDGDERAIQAAHRFVIGAGNFAALGTVAVAQVVEAVGQAQGDGAAQEAGGQ